MRSFLPREMNKKRRSASASYRKSKTGFSSGPASAVRRIHPETGEVIETVSLSKKALKTVGASAAEIEAAKSPAGAWTRETLAKWGVSWPPRRGWKKRLIDEHARAQRMARVDSVTSTGTMTGLVEPVSVPGQKYLVRMMREDVTEKLFIGSKVAHLWDGVDTACRMWSTSEMSCKRASREFVVYDHNPGLDVCHMCRSNAEKPKESRKITWGDRWED